MLKSDFPDMLVIRVPDMKKGHNSIPVKKFRESASYALLYLAIYDAHNVRNSSGITAQSKCEEKQVSAVDNSVKLIVRSLMMGLRKRCLLWKRSLAGRSRIDILMYGKEVTFDAIKI